MKNMTMEELKKRGLKTGDIYYSDFTEIDNNFTGWYLVLENIVVGLNTKILGAWRFRNSLSNISKIILSEVNYNVSPTKISQFVRTFDESLIDSLITHILPKTTKYVHAVHFGSAKLYTWRVPARLEKVDFKIGDIVEVDAAKGKQYVEVRETAEYEYDEKIKEVISLIKAYDLPF